MSSGSWFDPITRRRLQRFREHRRAYYSLLIIVFLYLTSLVAEVFCNDRPLYLRYDGKSYFPVLFFYPEDEFSGNGVLTRPDYKALNAAPVFRDNPDNYMLFPLLPFGPHEVITEDSVPLSDEVMIDIRQIPRVGSVNIDAGFSVRRQQQAAWFFPAAQTLTDADLRDIYALSPSFMEAVAQRFTNQAAEPYAQDFPTQSGDVAVTLSLSPYRTRAAPPETVRILLREAVADAAGEVWLYAPEQDHIKAPGALWATLPEALREQLRARAAARTATAVADLRFGHDGRDYRASFNKEDLRFPFRPTGPHLFGLDDSGRDVLARIFYGLRTSLNFGLLLVVASMFIGTIIGAIQGYYGGKIDLGGQRLTEIWEALPFLYVLILLGSVYGQSFMLLLLVYGIFNWTGISYYMRAEFLRLRKQQFIEAAQCLGLPDRKILFRHILPNALVPLTTFFPFSLVGAIGTLAALDYLGFGLPPPTASWGQLLAQAQGQAYWWLILYPSLALFLVILLCVFVGEGVRNAFDPRKFTRLE